MLNLFRRCGLKFGGLGITFCSLFCALLRFLHLRCHFVRLLSHSNETLSNRKRFDWIEFVFLILLASNKTFYIISLVSHGCLICRRSRPIRDAIRLHTSRLNTRKTIIKLRAKTLNESKWTAACDRLQFTTHNAHAMALAHTHTHTSGNEPSQRYRLV